jgi:hypothetical protein
MRQRLARLLLTALVGSGSLVLGACDNEDMRDVEEGVNDVERGVEDAVEDAEDAVDEADTDGKDD